jgi:FkbM family methyltransferase
MKPRHFVTGALLTVYGLVNKSGLLSVPLFERCFKRTYFLYKRYVEDNLYSLLRRHPHIIGSGNVIDVGANIGYTAVLFAKFAHNGSKVIAFEPDARNFEALKKTIRDCVIADKVEPAQVAIGESEGAVELWINESHHADHKVITHELKERKGESVARSVKVPMVSIDSVVESRNELWPVSLIKMDVQGYEMGVCQGMRKTLGMFPDAVVIFEHSPASCQELGFSADAVPNFFWERGYKLYAVQRGGRLKSITSRGVLAEIVRDVESYIDIVASKRGLIAA